MATVLLGLLYHKEHKKTMYKPFFCLLNASMNFRIRYMHQLSHYIHLISRENVLFCKFSKYFLHFEPKRIRIGMDFE